MKHLSPTILCISLFLCGATPGLAFSSLLNQVERKYQNSDGMEMSVTKKLKIPLLEKEKTSEGTIKIKRGGKFKWETEKPEKSLVLLTPEAVWVVDYPKDPTEKINVLKSRKPKKNQSPAVVTFLMGQGSLSKSFKVLSSQKDGEDLERFELQAKSDHEAVKKMSLWVEKKEKIIQKISFEDAVGNQTELDFSNVKFGKSFDKKEFKLKLPPNADVNIVD